MTKRIFALLLTVLMVVGLFAGCQQDGGDPSVNIGVKPTETDASGNVIENQKPYEGVTVTMAFYSNYEINADAWIFQQIKKDTGIIIEPICYTSNVYFEKLGNWIAKAELPDILYSGNLDKTEFDKYGAQGAFVNVNDPDVLAQIPSYKAIFVDNAENYEKYAKYLTSDGAMYAMPTYGVSRDVNHCLMYREDVFKDLGIEAWTDTESFLNALRKLKQEYPTSYPFTASDWFQTISRMAYSFDTNFTGTDMSLSYDWENEEWYFGAASEDFRELLDLLQTMYQEKLMDPDIFSNTSAEVDAMMLNNKSFVIYNWIGRMAVQNPAGVEQVDPDYHVVPGDAIGTGKYLELGKFSGAGGILVANNANQGAALAVIEWLYSDEGSFKNSVGVENDNFVYDENGNVTYPDLEAKLEEGETVTYQMLTEYYGMWIDGYYTNPSKEAIYYNYTEEEQMAQDMGNAAGYYRSTPPLIVPDSVASTWSDSLDSYKKYSQDFVTKYVMEGYGDAEWNAFVSKVEKDYGHMLDALNGK